MKEVELQESRRTALDDYLEVLGILGKKINEVEGILRENAEVTEEAMWVDEYSRCRIPQCIICPE